MNRPGSGTAMPTELSLCVFVNKFVIFHHRQDKTRIQFNNLRLAQTQQKGFLSFYFMQMFTFFYAQFLTGSTYIMMADNFKGV